MAAEQHDKHARGSCLGWRRGENAAVLRFRPHDTAIDLMLVGQVSATEREQTRARGWRLRLAWLAGLDGDE